MPKGKPNKLIAPIVIAGITVGFLVSAYKFLIHDHKSKKTDSAPQPQVQDPAQTDSSQATHKVPDTAQTGSREQTQHAQEVVNTELPSVQQMPTEAASGDKPQSS